MIKQAESKKGEKLKQQTNIQGKNASEWLIAIKSTTY
jgi:hypothetical protein